MPITTQESGGAALAYENAALEREIDALMYQRQTLAAANDRTVTIPQSYDDAVTQAIARAGRAEGAYQLAETNARLKIQQERPSEALARLWYEEGTLAAERERQAATQALAAAELARGRAVENERAYQIAKADLPGAHAAIDRACEAQHRAIDTVLMGLEMKRPQ